MSSILLALPIGFCTIWSLLAPIPVTVYETIARSPNTTQTVTDIFVYTQGNTLGFLQTLILAIATVTCPYALIATHARMSYAFARDGGLPFSYYLYHLDEQKIPIRALVMIVIIDGLLIVPSLLSSSLFAAINSIGTVGMFAFSFLPGTNTKIKLTT